MSNQLAVLIAHLGLFAATYGLFGFRVGLVVAGLSLFLAATLLLIDFPTGRSRQ